MTPPRRRRSVRYKGVPVPDWMADATGALYVVMILLALAGWLWDLLRAWWP